ncbi:MAG: hypothetical protein Q8P84_03475 [Deltaproteobacteria bacterium]|nr:hypothetical protein [Deltaproteobacteria bacterium]
MQSKWCEFKGRAVRLRKKGWSLRNIEKHLGVPKSTLSGWLKPIKIDAKKRKRLLENWRQALTKAQKKSVLWHHEQKANRVEEAKQYALKTMSELALENRAIQEMALAVLYIGEGRKSQEMVGMGSSDPLILKFFLLTLKKLYNIEVARLRCSLFLRADQDEEKIKRFWSKELDLPLHLFKGAYKDKRTVGSTTYEHYRGVCSFEYGDASIQRRLLFLGKFILEKVTSTLLGV